MIKSDIHPPQSGLNADPILYGVAAALAELFPPVSVGEDFRANSAQSEREDDRDDHQ